jgi:hypothetical protein
MTKSAALLSLAKHFVAISKSRVVIPKQMGEILDFSGSIGEGFEMTNRGRLRIFTIAHCNTVSNGET